MTKLTRLIAAALLISLSLSGCKARQEPQRAPERKAGSDQKKGTAKQDQDAVSAGAEKMQARLQDLRAALKSGDRAEATRKARELDDAWEAFEPKLKARNPDAHNQVELSLNAILAGVRVAPWDIVVIESATGKLNSQLKALQQSSGKPAGPKAVDLKTGVAAMRQQLSDLRAATDAMDTAKMQERATDADQAWMRFEAEVLDRSKEDYRTVEDSLHTILAQVKARPVDARKLKDEIAKRDAKLAKLAP